VNRSLKIKVCGMRQPQNISELVELTLDYIGLIFYPKSPRFVEDKEAEGVIKIVPESIQKVGVFVNELLEEVIRKAQLFNLQFLQLHGNETPSYCKYLKSLGYTVIKAFGVDKEFDFDRLKEYENCCDYFLFDTKSDKHGGTGKQFNWDIIKKYNNKKPLFLSGGIGPDDAVQILELKDLNIHAIDINSRFEIQPGLKNIDLLKTFIHTIKGRNHELPGR
jgi:phosphoribosylanthranilate isomerase